VPSISRLIDYTSDCAGGCFALVEIAGREAGCSRCANYHLLVPMVYFFIQGASSLPTQWGQISRFALQLVILNSAIYLIELALEG